MNVHSVSAARTAAAVILLATLAARVSVAQAPTESDREGVRRAVLDYVEGFYEADSAKHTRSILPGVYKYGYMWLSSQNRYNGSQMTWAEFHESVASRKAGGRLAPATAVKEVVIYEVLDQTASAKLTASWGVDYVLLAKQDGRWMISHVLWQSPPRGAR